MSEQNEASPFGGSVDRSKLEEMKAAAGDDPGLQAQVAEVQAQVDAVAESDEAAEKARQEAFAAQHPEGVELAEEQAEEPAEPEDGAEEYAEPVYDAPPRAGAGSGRDAWVAYAESQGVEVTDDMTRDDIIAATEE